MSRHSQWDSYEEFTALFPDLPNFRADEFLFLGGSHYDPTSRCFGKNWYPPEPLWKSIFELARHVQRIRTEFGSPITLTSIYRDEDYNACVGGARFSYHKQGKAADMIPVNGQVAHLLLVSSKLTPKGGVGGYSSFVHVDIRGRKARW